MAVKLEAGHFELSAKIEKLNLIQVVPDGPTPATSSAPGLTEFKLGQLERSVVELEQRGLHGR